MTLYGAQPPSTSNPVGGLVSYPIPTIGANLSLNPGFESVNATTHKPLNWSDNGFTLDTTVSHSGSASFKVSDPYAIQYSQYAWQDIPLKKGVYRIAGWMKTSGLGATKPGSVRICLTAQSSAGSGCTSLITGTNDWARYETVHIVIAQDVTARLSTSVYGEPDGTAWFDDIELRQEQQPLTVFMLYPNYRGILFDDQGSTARFHVEINPPGSTAATAYALSVTVAQEGATGGTLMTRSLAAQAQLDTSVDLTGLPTNLPFLVSFTLTDPLTGAVYTYPAYRLVRQPATARTAMSISVDQQNRFLLHGQPRFLLGVYDSGLGYTTLPQGWTDTLTQQRKLFELPIDLYLNYWYGGAANDSMMSMMNVLQQYGIYNLTNANCFSAATAAVSGAPWFLQNTDATLATRAAHPGFGGFYASDECQNKVVEDTFLNAQRMRAVQPGGIVFGTQLPFTYDLPLWRDTLDVIATDPYVVSGALPASGYYPLNKVSDAAKQTKDAVRGSRPFMTTIQFFEATSNSRWPTQQELRSMSYAAIVEGSNGLFYWSLGVRALSYVCSDWCADRTTYFNSLKAVMSELRSIDSVLTMPDQPSALIGNTNSAIHTRMKQLGALRYLIVFNTSGTSQTTTLSFSGSFKKVSTVVGPMMAPQTGGSSFTDTLAGFEPRIYLIQ